MVNIEDGPKSVLDQQEAEIQRFETVLFPENADVLRRDLNANGWAVVETANPSLVIAFKEEVAA